ncbi:hypothetical protein ZIOFF_019523 [Zingiber officinale]|uniref:Plant heme peroxidase family profile domain-containing protein n=1 Tax=Zingiber officinale TaxID=94328 RepID=A0A8J5HHY1_ZINOF|nr:hypothetical protein ZIOFF_019523 [Zingiber officinale]
MDGATWKKGWKNNQFHRRSKHPLPIRQYHYPPTKVHQCCQELTRLGELNASPLDIASTTSATFDNKYYTNLKNLNGLLTTDQDLLSAAGTSASIAPDVNRFAADQNVFFENFIEGMIKMGNIKVLTGDSGEVRSNCRVVNGAIRLRGRR